MEPWDSRLKETARFCTLPKQTRQKVENLMKKKGKKENINSPSRPPSNAHSTAIPVEAGLTWMPGEGEVFCTGGLGPLHAVGHPSKRSSIWLELLGKGSAGEWQLRPCT